MRFPLIENARDSRERVIGGVAQNRISIIPVGAAGSTRAPASFLAFEYG
jgi:hypothetical protein